MNRLNWLFLLSADEFLCLPYAVQWRNVIGMYRRACTAATANAHTAQIQHQMQCKATRAHHRFEQAIHCVVLLLNYGLYSQVAQINRSYNFIGGLDIQCGQRCGTGHRIDTDAVSPGEKLHRDVI